METQIEMYVEQEDKQFNSTVKVDGVFNRFPGHRTQNAAIQRATGHVLKIVRKALADNKIVSINIGTVRAPGSQDEE